MKYTSVILALGCLVPAHLSSQELLTLEGCRKIVLDSSLTVKIAANLIESTEARAKAVQRDYYPTIDAQGFYKYLITPVSINLEGDQYNGPNNLYEIGAGLHQNVYSGGKVRLETEISRYQQSMAGNNLTLTTDEILYQTELRYWKAAWTKEANKVALQYKELLDELVRVINEKVETGLIPMNDLLMSQVKQNEAELLIYTSRMQHEVSLMELNRIIGYDVKQDIDIASEDLYKDSHLPPLSPFEEVLVERPEVSIQQDRINISEKEINLARSKYLPQVSLLAQPIWGAPNTELLNPDPMFNAAFMANFSMPLVQWGKKRHEVNGKRVDYESSLLELQDLQDQIALELSSSYYQVEEAARRIKLTEASLKKARENYELIEDRYMEGLSPVIELLDAQYSWLLAYNSVLDSRLNYFYALATYHRITGTI